MYVVFSFFLSFFHPFFRLVLVALAICAITDLFTVLPLRFGFPFLFNITLRLGPSINPNINKQGYPQRYITYYYYLYHYFWIPFPLNSTLQAHSSCSAPQQPSGSKRPNSPPPPPFHHHPYSSKT